MPADTAGVIALPGPENPHSVSTPFSAPPIRSAADGGSQKGCVSLVILCANLWACPAANGRERAGRALSPGAGQNAPNGRPATEPAETLSPPGQVTIPHATGG